MGLLLDDCGRAELWGVQVVLEITAVGINLLIFFFCATEVLCRLLDALYGLVLWELKNKNSGFWA